MSIEVSTTKKCGTVYIANEITIDSRKITYALQMNEMKIRTKHEYFILVTKMQHSWNIIESYCYKRI